MGGGDMVHCLHGFDDEDGLPRYHACPNLDERWRPRFRRAIDGAHHRRMHGAWMVMVILAAAFGGFACRSAGIGRDGSGARSDRHGAGYAHPLTLMLDLDLAESGFAEELGKLADEVLVERPFFFGQRFLLLGHQPCLFGSIDATSASTASS